MVIGGPTITLMLLGTLVKALSRVGKHIYPEKPEIGIRNALFSCRFIVLIVILLSFSFSLFLLAKSLSGSFKVLSFMIKTCQW